MLGSLQRYGQLSPVVVCSFCDPSDPSPWALAAIRTAESLDGLLPPGQLDDLAQHGEFAVVRVHFGDAFQPHPRFSAVAHSRGHTDIAGPDGGKLRNVEPGPFDELGQGLCAASWSPLSICS